MFFACCLVLLLPSSPYTAMLPSCVYLRADPDGSGSAWVVNAEKKWFLTCRHVVGEQTRVEIFFPRFDNERLRTLRGEYLSDRVALKASGHLVVGKVLKTSEAFDLALVEVPTLPAGVRALPLAATSAEIGLPVWALGHRGDVETLFNLSSGVVRQRGRIADGYFWQARTLLENAPGIVAQLPIAEGDSGAPIANYRGEVVGVVSAFRNRSPSAAFGPDAASIRKFLDLLQPSPLEGEGGAQHRVRGIERANYPSPRPEAGRPSPSRGEGESLAERLARSTVWVRPTATDARTAGVVIDTERRWVLTSASGLGKYDRVGVAFPEIVAGRVVGERDAYRDPVALYLKKLWFPGTVLYRDAARDLAVIELDSLPTDARALPLAEIDARPGEKVHSISHPTGLEFAFVYSAGTVKQHGAVALGRDTEKVETMLVQLPAQGNASGGPVANARGELLGVLAGKETANGQVAYTATTTEVRVFLAEARIAAIRGPLLRFWNELNSRAGLLLRTHYLWGAAHFHDESWNAALAEFDAIIEAEPLNRTALLFRAAVLRKLKEPKKAIADLQRLLDYNPADVVARLAYADAWADAGDTVRAAKERVNALNVKGKP